MRRRTLERAVVRRASVGPRQIDGAAHHPAQLDGHAALAPGDLLPLVQAAHPAEGRLARPVVGQVDHQVLPGRDIHLSISDGLSGEVRSGWQGISRTRLPGSIKECQRARGLRRRVMAAVPIAAAALSMLSARGLTTYGAIDA